MALILRSPLARLSTALLGAATLALAVPSVSNARDWDDHRGGYQRPSGHSDWGHDKHHKHYKHYKHDQRRDYGRPYCDYRGDRYYGHSYVTRRRPAHYYCDPCGHGFGSRAALYDHAHYHHYIPRLRIPSLVVHVGLDWVFGY